MKRTAAPVYAVLRYGNPTEVSFNKGYICQIVGLARAEGYRDAEWVRGVFTYDDATRPKRRRAKEGK